jgi:hypothetical protein
VALTAHVRELLASALEVISVLGLDGILDGTRHGVVGAENRALHKLDLARHAALEAAGGSNGTAGLLSLPPCCGRAGLAPCVWGRCSLRRAKVCRVVVAAGCRVDVGAVVRLAGVLRGPVVGICLRQAVCRVRAVVWLAVKRVWVGARCVFVEQRAADFILVHPTVVLGPCQHAVIACSITRATHACVRVAIYIAVREVRIVRHFCGRG